MGRVEELYGLGRQELEWQGERAAFSDLGYRQKREPFVTEKAISLFYKYGLYLPNKMI